MSGRVRGVNETPECMCHLITSKPCPTRAGVLDVRWCPPRNRDIVSQIKRDFGTVGATFYRWLSITRRCLAALPSSEACWILKADIGEMNDPEEMTRG